MVKTTTAGILALVCAWGLTACGGGGGGSDNDRNPTPPPSSEDIELDPDGYAERQATISSQTDTDLILELYGDAESTYLLVDEVDNAVTSREPSRISGDTEIELTYDCDNSGQVVITLNGVGQSDDERWRFTNCELSTTTFGSVVLNGKYNYVNKVNSDGNSGFQEFDISGTDIASGADIKVNGVDRWEIVESNGGRKETYSTDALEFIIGEDYFAIANAQTTLEVDNSGAVISLASKLIGSAIGGYIEISTQKSVFVASGESCPQSGIIRLNGEGGTFADIRYLDDTGTGDVAMIVIDSSGEAVPYNTCESLIF